MFATRCHADRLQAKVIAGLQEAHAMEDQMIRMLDSMIATTADDDVLHRLRRHNTDTKRHEKMLRDRRRLAQGHW
jgi:ferritin-like metal-binding protein YciE